MSAATVASLEQFVRRRVEDGGGHGAPLRDERRRDGELGLALEEGSGAVDGIDDEDAFGLEPGGIVLGLFGQPAIAGAGLTQAPLEKVVDGEVGLADRIARLLFPARYIGAKVAHGHCTRLAHGGGEQGVIALEPSRRQGGHPHPLKRAPAPRRRRRPPGRRGRGLSRGHRPVGSRATSAPI